MYGTRRVSGKTFIGYAHIQKIGIEMDLMFWGARKSNDHNRIANID
jgi:hypothetical protein